MTKIRNPFPIIPHRPDDEPKICIEVNRSWLPALLGMVQPYRYPEHWLGTLAENKQARSDVLKLLDILTEAERCDMTNECCIQTIVIIHRIDPITLQLQISIDGGETWTTDPESPVNKIVAQSPPVPAGISATKCDAATNGKQHIEDLILACHDWLGTAESVYELVVGIMTALLVLVIAYFTLGAAATAAAELAGTIWAAGHAAFDYGIAAFDANWTTEERDKILCALFCHIGDDGTFTNSQYQAFLGDWKSKAAVNPAFWLVYNSLTATGLVGLNNLCSYGNAADADCESCPCGCANDFVLWETRGSNFVTGNDENGDYVQAEAVYDEFNFGGYVVAFTSGDMDTCCAAVLTQETPEVTSGTWAYSLCGEAIPNYGQVFPHSGLKPIQDVNTIARNSSTPFTLRIYFA